MKKITVFVIVALLLVLATPALAAGVGQEVPDLSTPSPEMISFVAGIGISLIFSYVPKLKTAYDALDGDYKRLIMLLSLLVAAGAIYGLSCANIYNLVPCTTAGAWLMVEYFILAAIGSQGAFLLAPKFKKDEFA